MWCDWGLILLSALFLPTLTAAENSEENRKESIATNNPRFVSRGGVRELREGESSELECLVEDLGEFIILWKLNRTQVLFAGNLRINRDERYSLTSQALTIRGIQSDMSGEYSCQISTNPPREIVYVIKFLSVPQIQRLPENGELRVKKNEMMRLACNVNHGGGGGGGGGGGMPTRITWRKVNGKTPFNVEYRNSNSEFVIRRAEAQHSGVYECIAENQIGENSQQFSVQVEYAPEITVQDRVIHSWIGMTANISCQVLAQPLPLMVWTKRGREITLPYRLSSNNETSTITVTINNNEDFSEYNCLANNTWGQTSKTIDLTRRPSTPRFTSAPVGNKETTYELFWHIDSDTPIHSYTLRIRADDDSDMSYNGERRSEWRIIPIEPNHQNKEHNRVTRSQSFTIDNLTRLTSYDIYLEAQNEFGATKSDLFSFATSVGYESGNACRDRSLQFVFTTVLATITTLFSLL